MRASCPQDVLIRFCVISSGLVPGFLTWTWRLQHILITTMTLSSQVARCPRSAHLVSTALTAPVVCRMALCFVWFELTNVSCATLCTSRTTLIAHSRPSRQSAGSSRSSLVIVVGLTSNWQSYKLLHLPGSYGEDGAKPSTPGCFHRSSFAADPLVEHQDAGFARLVASGAA